VQDSSPYRSPRQACVSTGWSGDEVGDRLTLERGPVPQTVEASLGVRRQRSEPMNTTYEIATIRDELLTTFAAHNQFAYYGSLYDKVAPQLNWKPRPPGRGGQGWGRKLGSVLFDVARECQENGEPSLAALVRRKKTGRVAPGFDDALSLHRGLPLEQLGRAGAGPAGGRPRPPLVPAGGNMKSVVCHQCSGVRR
jgi:hypothetical protein